MSFDAMDFTLSKYSYLIGCLQKSGYQFITFEDYCLRKNELSDEKFIILRHDVDLKAENSLATAKIEHSLGIQASYYFRVVKQSNKPEVIRSIVSLGHEIGYHYEDMAICNGDFDKAILHFEKQLAYFQSYYPVKTICMHGVPRSKYDGKDLWKKTDYHNFGIIGEPYFDVDFSKVFYLTDTGRRWDGFRVSVRDKVPVFQEQWIKDGLVFHSTDDLVKAIHERKMPSQLMITTHPQRWTDNWIQWFWECVTQSLKNVIKWFFIKVI